MNICEHLTATARIFPERDAIQFEGKGITYEQLDRMSIAASEQLQAAEIHPGDRVAIMLPNVPAFAVWYYAALRIGAIAVSISTRAAASEVAYFVDDCEAKFFVADKETLAKVQSELPSCLAKSVCTSDLGDTIDDQALSIADAIQSTWFDAHPNDAALILYTSGTTGFAKGATLSHMNVRSNVHAFNHLCNMQSEDRILLAVPLFHCFGQNALLNSALNVGATLVLQRRFDLNESKRLITEQNITQLYGVPMMFQLFLDSCVKSDLSSVNYCFSAAATLPIQVGEKWQQKFDMPINEGYGLTETSPFASYNHRLKFTSGSIGTPINAVEMKVIDTETDKECQPGELGEIVIRGPNVMLGYWNREEDTKLAIRDGWFYSGDIGRVDDQGYFYIVDRVKDMIAVGGLKVYPAEVERILHDHPSVSEAAVVGIRDDVFGEQVVAFVVLAASDQSVDKQLASIQTYAKQQLANYKVPRVVLQLDELPRNPSGKILKRELREFNLKQVEPNAATLVAEQAGTNLLTPQAQLRPPQLRTKLVSTYANERQSVATVFVQHLVQELANLDEIPDAHEKFLDAGMDSLMIVELSNQIQVELGTEHQIPATLVFDYPRIADLSEFLLKAMFPTEESSRKVEPETDSPRSSPQLRNEIESMSDEEALAELMKELES